MICVYHSIDLDGWTSAAIVRLKFPDCELLGYNHGQPVPDLFGHDMVVMCDIAFPPNVMLELKNRLGSNFIWIDHHISSINTNKGVHGGFGEFEGLTDPKFAACELTWKYFYPDITIPEGVRLLGRYDCFGHKDTPEELNVLLFQFAARARWNDPYSATAAIGLTSADIGAMLMEGLHIYQFLLTEAKQSYANGFVVDFDGYKFITINKERFNPINFGIKYHDDGYAGAACFHYANGNWNFSLYNDNGEVDCSTICTKRGGGGHKGAAGFVTKNIEHYVPNK